MDGLELLHEIFRRWPESQKHPDFRMERSRAEAMPPDTQFLLKPVSRRSLDQALEGVLPS